MSPNSQPSLPSIGSLQRELLPKPAQEALHETARAAAMSLQPNSMVHAEPLSTEEAIGRKLCVLAEFMKSRPANASLVKVVAVDGSDRLAVHGMIATLQHRITRDLRYMVRVISEDWFYPPNSQPTELSHFYRQIQSWGAMWEMILHTPSIPLDPRFPDKRLKPAPMHPDNPTTSLDCPLIYILPLSPLMATMQAVQCTMGSNDPWRLLCGYWKGNFRPDVTINIQNIADTYDRYEVLRIQIQGLKALVITKEGDTGLTITPQQMRRAIFEVEEWIRWEQGLSLAPPLYAAFAEPEEQAFEEHQRLPETSMAELISSVQKLQLELNEKTRKLDLLADYLEQLQPWIEDVSSNVHNLLSQDPLLQYDYGL